MKEIIQLAEEIQQDLESLNRCPHHEGLQKGYRILIGAKSNMIAAWSSHAEEIIKELEEQIDG